VVTKWSHDVTWKSGCFSASERGDFLKNYGILQNVKIGLFLGDIFLQLGALLLAGRIDPKSL